MITRKPSKIVDSIVNSSHEEHLNVSKAIRDDAPITNLTSCVKSINFEADGDGAYILRKPLIKKESLKSLTNPVTYPFEFYLSDKEHKAIISETTVDEVTTRSLQIPGATKIVLKFYDNDLKEHKIESVNNSINIDWLTIKSTFNTSDHTIINGIVNHRTFLDRYSVLHSKPSPVSHRQVYWWEWTLVNATQFYSGPSAGGFGETWTLTNLKRFLKIYESVDEPNTFILEIVHPEINTFTTALDVGNTEGLETNLLLDNPYAIRDLYGYGYISATKIVPYVINKTREEEDELMYSDVDGSSIWELTENDFVPEEEQHAPSQMFRMLVSSNPSVFNRRFLILKAFLTTAVTNIDYYCCWEVSKNGGIDWEVCQEFIDKFNLTDEDEQTVSDLTSKEFNDMVYKESLTEAQSYIVKKKLYHMESLKTKDYHQNDAIRNRPDVLILENPDLSKLYRFTIYVKSNKQTPDPIEETHTQVIPSFTNTTGDVPGTDGKIKFEVIDNSSAASVEDSCIELHEGTQTLPAPVDGVYPQYFPNLTPGDALHIYSTDPLYKLKSVSYTLSPSRLDTSVTPNKLYNAVALVGTSFENYTATNINLPIEKQTGIDPTVFINPYGLQYNINYDNKDTNIETIISDSTVYGQYINMPSSVKTVILPDSNQSSDLYISNIFGCVYNINVNKSISDYEEPFVIDRDVQLIAFNPPTGRNIRIDYTKDNDSNALFLMDNGIEIEGSYPSDYYWVHKYRTAILKRQQNGKFTLYPNVLLTIRLTDESGSHVDGTVESVDYQGYSPITDIDRIRIHPEESASTYLVLDEHDTPTVAAVGETWNAQRVSDWLDSDATFDPSTNIIYDKTPVLSNPIYEYLQNTKHIDISSAEQARLKIQSLTIEYSKTENVVWASVYLASQTGSYQVPYSSTTILALDLTSERNKIFDINSKYFYNENQAQLLVYNDKFVYASGTNSAIMRLMNSLSLPEEVTKIISWRGYLLLFSPRNIYLAKYNSSIDGYDIKVLSNTVGVSDVDADTIIPVLNSGYFKSGNKIYKLVPNLYAASDDILNIHQVSTGINNILEGITNAYEETHNFSYADADTYMVFMPIQTSNITICICYDFVKQVWTMQKYSKYLNDIEKFSNIEIYLKDSNSLYYFKDSMAKIMSEARTALDPDLDTILHTIPYSDYLTTTPAELIAMLSTATVDAYNLIRTPIQFEIDFGQKSSNYTLDKQFLESKLILATLSSKDNFPLTIDIYTDGVSRELHWDANTDGALMKSGLDSYGVLNTNFVPDGVDYNGIFKQLIVKYSGKGKSIRHVISGESKSLFKFYSMDVRGRILAKKH